MIKYRVFITGCGGMLGDAIYSYFKDKTSICATDIDLNDTWLTYLDVRDYDEYRKQVLEFKPDVCMHLAALTDLEYCELNPDEAYKTNTIGVENSVLVAREIDALLVYISTAGIFNGEKDYYDDWDMPDPISVYGRSKYMGESFIEKHYDKYFICRAGWMMGGGPKKDKKFVNKIMKQIEKGNTDLYAVKDKSGTPTYTHDLSRNIYNLINTNYYGLYNMVCEGSCSRYDVAKEIVKILNGKDEININIVNSEYFCEEYYAPRPSSEKLINTKLNLRGLNKMGNWKAQLNKYIYSSYKHLIKQK